MITFLKKEISTKYKTIFYVLSCLVILPFHIFHQPSAGVDPSWAISINLAIKYHLVWGKDYIYTYGPLGYLATGIREYVPSYLIVMFHLLIWINISFIFYKIL